MTGVKDIREVTDNILKDHKDIILHIPLEDLIWAIVSYSYSMRYDEDELFTNTNLINVDRQHLIRDRECSASRRDELARIIGQYSDFDTQMIWEVIRESKIFRNY